MKWIKTNGNKIETNDLPATLEYCESLGWKEDKAKAKKAKIETNSVGKTEDNE